MRIFKILLRYLYCGHLEDFENYSTETLADLMTITDRYEVCYREITKITVAIDFESGKYFDEKSISSRPNKKETNV